MKVSKLFFCFLFFSISNVLLCQTNTEKPGKIIIKESASISELMQKQTEVNSKTPIKGYRIKIHFGTDKTESKEVKTKFLLKFPNVPAYDKYDQPNFNIRVGDFRTKLEAYKLLKEVLLEFPGAFIVQDEIEFPSL